MGISTKSEMRYHNFSFFGIFQNEIFEKREVVEARSDFEGDAHTRWRSPDHKVLLNCVIFGPLNSIPGRTDSVAGGA
jgi:hypothetical protein